VWWRYVRFSFTSVSGPEMISLRFVSFHFLTSLIILFPIKKDFTCRFFDLKSRGSRANKTGTERSLHIATHLKRSASRAAARTVKRARLLIGRTSQTSRSHVTYRRSALHLRRCSFARIRCCGLDVRVSVVVRDVTQDHFRTAQYTCVFPWSVCNRLIDSRQLLLTRTLRKTSGLVHYRSASRLVATSRRNTDD